MTTGLVVHYLPEPHYEGLEDVCIGLAILDCILCYVHRNLHTTHARKGKMRSQQRWGCDSRSVGVTAWGVWQQWGVATMGCVAMGCGNGVCGNNGVWQWGVAAMGCVAMGCGNGVWQWVCGNGVCGNNGCVAARWRCSGNVGGNK